MWSLIVAVICLIITFICIVGASESYTSDEEFMVGAGIAIVAGVIFGLVWLFVYSDDDPVSLLLSLFMML